jgi:steroid 5-alpha reductase family enzyme
MGHTDTSARFSKKISSLICLAAYAVALLAAAVTIYLINHENTLLAALAADCIATLVIFAFSIGFNNSSMYDPFWSAAPLPIALYWAWDEGIGRFSVRRAAVIILVGVWGARLTYNWLRQWKGIVHEDWRYVNFRNRTGPMYWLVSLTGIHLYPTIMVFAGCVSIYYVMVAPAKELSIIDTAALIITGGAIVIEAVADHQLRSFVKSGPTKDAILSTGLWAYSRHPNYFGEIMFWWGLFLFSVATDGFLWSACAGPCAITIMFITVSIPMMERRMLSRRPHYAQHQRTVSALIPWFRKKR